MIYRIVLFLLLLQLSFNAKAQIMTGEPMPGVLLGLDYNQQWPLADMSKRFGNNASVGGMIQYKTASNWLIGLNADYLFGTKIKEDSFVVNLITKGGSIIGTNGETANVQVHERGYIIGPTLGRIFPVREENKNSGIIVQFGIGFMTHRIKIVDVEGIVPQLKPSYQKGYDRLTSGVALSQFIGYQNLDRNKLLNFYAGIELVEGINRGQRDFLFDVQRPGTDSRLDMLFGIKAGWILPIYGKRDDDYYYH